MHGKRPPLWQKTRTAPDYRAFLEAYLEESRRSRSDFARAAGFGRGFPGDVISGRRRLTAKSYLAFENALKLPPSGRKLFRCLVALEEPSLFPSLDSARAAGLAQELRGRPWTRVRGDSPVRDPKEMRALFANPDVFAAYAAAGSAETGAALETIAARTRLPENALLSALAGLEKAGLLSRNGDGAYRPCDTHVFLKAFGKDEAFAALFRSACARASERVAQTLHSDEEMFFTSSFCVDEKRLPELKLALRRAMLQFVDEAIDPDGGAVVRLVTSMFR